MDELLKLGEADFPFVFEKLQSPQGPQLAREQRCLFWNYENPMVRQVMLDIFLELNVRAGAPEGALFEMTRDFLFMKGEITQLFEGKDQSNFKASVQGLLRDALEHPKKNEHRREIGQLFGEMHKAKIDLVERPSDPNIRFNSLYESDILQTPWLSPVLDSIREKIEDLCKKNREEEVLDVINTEILSDKFLQSLIAKEGVTDSEFEEKFHEKLGNNPSSWQLARLANKLRVELINFAQLEFAIALYSQGNWEKSLAAIKGLDGRDRFGEVDAFLKLLQTSGVSPPPEQTT